MVTLTVDERELMALVVCAYHAAEVESAFDITEIERMPTPFPEMLARVRRVHEHWMSLDFPYDTYPEGWEAAALAS
ncbi:hypothetical protein M3D75_02725 [Microbacterium enclense]|uniref:hypothetical protein n=1 Tax=Microbacterium enclense TaxID=993073 RepID=UPI0021A59910|nr:hypothetical protein [Microbacterium enclense]MCT2085021.1 hypothetical protein [Microbacterium enclense]